MKIKSTAAALAAIVTIAGVLTLAALAQPAAEPASGTTVAPAPAAAGTGLDLDQVIDKLQDNYSRIQTYQAEFEQEIWSQNQGRVVTQGEGKVLYKKPGKMVWHYQKPEEHVFINEGNTIWDYSPVEKEAYQLPVKDSVYKSFLVGLGDLRQDFEISFHSGKKTDREGFYQLDLVPKNESERQVLGVMTFYVNPQDFMVHRTESVDALGNRNSIKFKNFKLDLELGDALFKFTPPKGVTVIKPEEMPKPN